MQLAQIYKIMVKAPDGEGNLVVCPRPMCSPVADQTALPNQNNRIHCLGQMQQH